MTTTLMGETTAEALHDRIAQLSVEHRDLDRAIAALTDAPVHDELQIKRLKRRKLLLKDQIAWLNRQIEPDIPA